MLLRLEHVHDVGPERLIRLYDIRSGWIAVAAYGEIGCRPMHLDAVLQ